VLIHSLLCNLKPGDITADVATRAIAVLSENYFLGRPCPGGLPARHAYAGPREALLHRFSGRTTACSHQIVGRDTGVGSYTALRRAPHLRPDPATRPRRSRSRSTGTSVLSLRRHGLRRTCPHGDADRLNVSGTEAGKWLSEGARCGEFSRPEVLEILREYYAGLTEKVR